MVISIDHGNKCIKTENFVFTSGITESLVPPPMDTDTIFLGDRYYSLSTGRIPYMRNKTQDNRFQNLTLFAIAKELDKRNMLQEGIEQRISLLCGLPPAHYSNQYKAFEEYLMLDKSFIYKGRKMQITIPKVYSYPQGYAAAMSEYNKISGYSKVIVLDIGGYTLDIIYIYDGEVIIDACDSLDNGVIPLYNRIISKLNSSYGIVIDEREIDNVLYEKANSVQSTMEPSMMLPAQSPGTTKKILLEPKVKDFIVEQTVTYIQDILGLLRERKIDFNSNFFAFVGGGSILLYKYFMNTSMMKHTMLIDDIKANEKGYKILYNAFIGEQL